MGRPEPCVLFAQTFTHDVLDEYVDEVLFAEPVVITACEFLEQNASSTCSAVKILGGTSPPSFALEVFVQCEGETRFRRLCQPFLYSHSSSNVLEVEAIVTNHLVIRGSYRSLSLVVYGNTTEDLGQFNIEVDLDSSLTNTGNAVEGDLEYLPPALNPTNLPIEEYIFPLKKLSLKVSKFDIPVEIRQLIQLTFKILDSPNVGVAIDTVLNLLSSVALVHATPSLSSIIKNDKHALIDCMSGGDFQHVVNEAKKELLDVYKNLQHQLEDAESEFIAENMFLESAVDLDSSKQLVDSFFSYFQFGSNFENAGCPELSQNKNATLWSSLALLLCSTKESCFHFVNSGCMEKLGYAFSCDMLNSASLRLVLLGVVEQATRHSIGCEGFLGWWPREYDNVPPGNSEGYNQLLKLLLETQRHDVASVVTYILNRLRLYEIASRYEFAVLSILGSLSAVEHITNVTVDMLSSAKIQLKNLLKLISLRGPIEDPTPVACASRSLLLSDTGLLSYKATSSLINQSKCCFRKWDVDSNVLLLLKERGFLPLSAALLSSHALRSETGHLMDLFVDIVLCIESIIFSLLFSRSGLMFLLSDPDISITIIHALKGANDWKRNKQSASLRYASVLISKGFFCHPQEVGFILEMYLKAINAVDRLITSTPGTEEFLWILWELCGLSRSDCGRQALLALVHYPEALSVLMAALQSVKELDPVSLTTGAAPVNLAIFHAAAEIFEVVVMDSMASSLGAWIDHANELHKILNSSSPGSNKKDAPARLLEWIDAGVVFHRNGAIGLLRYAALLASGGDAHMSSTSILTSDVMDVENVVGETSNSSDGNVIDNLLGKRITEKDFPGLILRESSVVQLTTAFRILAFISDHSAVAAALYDEGAVMVVHAVLINCKVMLERSSNIYDYLVDEGTECNATSDLLLERNREESLIALLIPSLVLLNNLLQKLQETKEQHRNTKLLSALLQLHREVSPKLAACAFNLSYPYPESTLGLETVCHLLVSILACWPAYGWTPGLFHFLVDNLQTTSLLALGPKEICSLFCLLNDIFPDEGLWLWKNSIPMLGPVRSFALGTILGPQKESQINWYLQTGYSEKMLGQLAPQLDKIGQIILHCAISTLLVIQDMIRVLIIRIANLNSDNASALLRPMILWVYDHLSGPLTLSETDSFKIYQVFEFLAMLLEHPCAKPLLLKDDGIKMFVKALENCLVAATSDAKHYLESRDIPKYGVSHITWCIPVLKCIKLICRYPGSVLLLPGKPERKTPENLSSGEYCLILSCILKLCKVLPVGKELIACLSAFKELGYSSEGKNALQSILVEDSDLESNRCDDRDPRIFNSCEWREYRPLQFCWTALLRSFASQDSSQVYVVEAIGLLSSGALQFCIWEDSLSLESIAAIKYLFGVGNDGSAADGFLEGSIKSIQELANLLGSEVFASANSLLLLLQKPPSVIKVDDISASVQPPSPTSGSLCSRVHKLMDRSCERIADYDLNEFGETFSWECPENFRDRLTQTGVLAKRKMPSVDGPNRRARGDSAPSETTAQTGFSRGSVPPASSGPTRRDTFRQRKPNTSRPPSMHVDDYVARERSADSTGNPNVIAIPRVGSSSGRPPSIHVDEFMARQRDRQHPVGMASSDATAQPKVAPPENNSDAEKFSKSRPVKPDLDDDIDIVFDAEESDPDDKLPFPQPDDNLPQPASVVVEQSSPHSIVEETESDANGNSQFSHLNAPLASNMDETTPSGFSSRMSVSYPERSLTREPSVSSEKKFPDQSDESKSYAIKPSGVFDSAPGASSSGFSTSYAKVNSASAHVHLDSRARQNLYTKSGVQQGASTPSAVGSQGAFDQKFQPSQPPLPPLPPPPTISPSLSQNSDPIVSQSSPFVNPMGDMQPSIPPGFHVHGEYFTPYPSSSVLTSSSPLPDSKYGRTSLSSSGGSGSARPHPPLPPTPHPHSMNPSTISSSKNPASQSLMYSQNVQGGIEFQQSSIASSSDIRLNNYSASGAMPTSLLPPMLFSRPGSIPVGLYGSGQSHHLESMPSISQNNPISLPSMHALPSLGQLQPLQPPQLPRPATHLRPVVPVSSQQEQAGSLGQSPLQMQMLPLQVLQQPQISPVHIYYQTPQSENVSRISQQQQVEHSQAQVLRQPGDVMSQQQDPGMTLQEYFKSPEAIQSLLSDRDKLCQLLEQHPKLMQMLQERLGQL